MFRRWLLLLACLFFFLVSWLELLQSLIWDILAVVPLFPPPFLTVTCMCLQVARLALRRDMPGSLRAQRHLHASEGYVQQEVS